MMQSHHFWVVSGAVLMHPYYMSTLRVEFTALLGDAHWGQCSMLPGSDISWGGDQTVSQQEFRDWGFGLSLCPSLIRRFVEGLEL